jgi:hypothetical protein
VKARVNTLFRELKCIFIIMECILGPFCCHFHQEERIGHVEFDEVRPEERNVIVISVATLLQGLLHMKAQMNASQVRTYDQNGATVKTFSPKYLMRAAARSIWARIYESQIAAGSVRQHVVPTPRALSPPQSLTHDGDAFVESVIRNSQGFGPKLSYCTPPSSYDVLTGFTRFAGSGHVTPVLRGAQVETFQVGDNCEILTGHLMASIRELVVCAAPRLAYWVIHELEEWRVRATLG